MHRKKNGEEYWVFPGGGVEDTESAEEALVREVKEETGLEVLKFNLAFKCFNELSETYQPFFICEVGDGEPEIIGEEKDRNNADNWYHLEWIEKSKIKDIWLVPDDAKGQLMQSF